MCAYDCHIAVDLPLARVLKEMGVVCAKKEETELIVLVSAVGSGMCAYDCHI